MGFGNARRHLVPKRAFPPQNRKQHLCRLPQMLLSGKETGKRVKNWVKRQKISNFYDPQRLQPISHEISSHFKNPKNLCPFCSWSSKQHFCTQKTIQSAYSKTHYKSFNLWLLCERVEFYCVKKTLNNCTWTGWVLLCVKKTLNNQFIIFWDF